MNLNSVPTTTTQSHSRIGKRRAGVSVTITENDNPYHNNTNYDISSLLLTTLNNTLIIESPKTSALRHSKRQQLTLCLASHPLFLSLSTRCKRSILNEMILKTYSPNTVLQRVNEEIQMFYVIQNGNVVVSTGNSNTTTTTTASASIQSSPSKSLHLRSFSQ